MTFPAPFTTSTFADGEEVDNTKLYARVLRWLNAFLAYVLGLGAGFIGDDIGAAVAAFGATGTTVATGAAQVTWTSTSRRRYRVYMAVGVACNSSAPAHYYVSPAYSHGGALDTGDINGIGAAYPIVLTQTTYSFGASCEGTVVLGAGTYTAFVSGQRTAGGSTSDHFTDSAYVAVYDIGAA